MPPKVALRKDPILRYQIRLAERLGKTLAELGRDLGEGEIATWIAHDELEYEARQTKAQTTHDAARALHRRF